MITEYVSQSMAQKSDRTTPFMGVESGDRKRYFATRIDTDKYCLTGTKPVGSPKSYVNWVYDGNEYSCISSIAEKMRNNEEKIVYADSFKEIVMWAFENVGD